MAEWRVGLGEAGSLVSACALGSEVDLVTRPDVHPRQTGIKHPILASFGEYRMAAYGVATGLDIRRWPTTITFGGAQGVGLIPFLRSRSVR